MKPISETLTAIGLDQCPAAISDAAYAAAERLLLDSLGCALAGNGQPGISDVCRLMQRWGGAPEADMLFHACRLPAPQAAFANSAMIHALDYDDVYSPASLHLTSVIVPVALVSAQMEKTSGKDLLAAIIMGIEVAIRIGRAEKEYRRGLGFLPSSLVGGFGAVIAAARLLHLDHTMTVHAMGIAYAQAAGNRQALLDMTLTKRLQPGFAARSALWAVELARNGISGPHRAFEGKAGYGAVYLNGGILSLEDMATGNSGFYIEKVSIKRYPSCGACHKVQEAAELLMAEEQLDARDIDRIELFGCGPGGLVGGPFDPGDHPQVAAQFCAAWGVAHTVLRGPAVLEDYRDEAVASDHEVAVLANAIQHVDRPENLPPLGPQPPGFHPGAYCPQGVIFYTRDGRKLIRARTPAQTSDPARATMETVQAKFHECARYAGIKEQGRVQKMIDTVLELRQAHEISEMMRQFSVIPYTKEH